MIKHPRGALRLSNARALYPQHQIRRRARRNGSALELLVAALVVVTSTAIYSLSRSGRGGVSDQKWPHTISLCVDRHQVTCREIATWDAFSCKKWAANFFWPGDVPLYRLPPAPVSAVHPAPALKSLFASSPAARGGGDA